MRDLGPLIEHEDGTYLWYGAPFIDPPLDPLDAAELAALRARIAARDRQRCRDRLVAIGLLLLAAGALLAGVLAWSGRL